MSEITDAVTTKIGPLPAWTWGLGVGALIIGVRTFRNRSTPKPETTPEAPPAAVELDGEAFELSAGPTAFPVYRPSGGSGSSFTASDAPTTSTGPTTNAGWSTAAARWGLANTAYAPTTITDAVSKYLQGSELSATEYAFVNEAIRAIGPAPEGAPSVMLKPAPVSPPPTPTPQNPAPVAPPPPAPVAPPAAPPPAPPPAARVVARSNVYRWNGGPDGPGGFFSVVLWSYTDGSAQLQWIPDGNTYLALASGGVTTLDLAGIQRLMTSHPHEASPRPPWTPPGTSW